MRIFRYTGLSHLSAMAGMSYSSSSSSSFDSSCMSFLASGRDESSCTSLLGIQDNVPSTSEDLLFFDSPVLSHSTPVLHSTPVFPPAAAAPPPPAHPPPVPSRDLVFHLSISPPPPTLHAPAPQRDVETELRTIVDDLLRRKKDTQRTLAEENASLRAQVAFFKEALALASAQPGSETAGVLDALDRERTLRQNAEELRAATGKFLAEQVESVSKQKLALEDALRNFTHGREYWREKAIAAFERCEVLEAENLRVKTQLNALARKQSNVVTQQVNSVLREVAEERDRLKQLEEVELLGQAPAKTLEGEV